MQEIKIAGAVKASIFKKSLDKAVIPPPINQDFLRGQWSESCCGFIDYWASLRRGALVPTFEQFSETMSARFTPSVYIVELTDEAAIVRFQGTELVERWAGDLTGHDIHTGFPHYFRSRSLWNMRNVATFPCGLFGRAAYLTSRGRNVTSDHIQLPLAAAEGSAPRLVHYSDKVTDDAVGETIAQYAKIHKHEWFDIGAGVPPTLPLDGEAKAPAGN